MDHHPENSSSQSISSQQLPHIRTDTDTSSIHNSSLDPATRSLSITATRNTAPSTTRSAAPTSVLRAVTSQSDQQQQQQPHFVKVLSAQSPHMSAAGLAASNGSVSFSSVDETGQPRRYSNPRPHAFQSATPSQPHRSTANDRLSVGGRGLRQSPLQRRNSGDNSVMDAISQSLNAHNDPELEGLPPMGEDSSSPDGSTVLYAKGFLISTSPGADREAGAANTSGPDYHLSAHLQDEEQQQQQQQKQQPNNEHSVGDVSRSRGPAGNASGISHRLLTVEEIQERRRATSRPVSQAHSHVLSAAREPNKSTATTTNTNVNNRSVSLSGKPAHRQLSKEETEKMIALRQQQFKEQEKAKQQQRAAVAASAAQAAAAAASANTSATAASAPRRTSPPSQRTPPANSAGTGGAQLNSNAAPWLMPSEAAHRSMMQGQPNQQQQQQQGSGGGVNFEWVRGVSAGHNGGMPVDGNAQPWPGAAHPWHDAAAAAAAASVGGLHPSFYPSGSGGTAETGVPHAVMGDGGSNGAAGFTWLPNATYWSTLDQQQQQQSALIPSMASPAGQHDAFAFLAGSSAMMSTAGPLGSSSGNNTNNSSSGGANGGGGSSLGATAASPFSAPLSSLTMNVLKSLPMSQLQASIRQCDEQLQRVRQDRELLCHELQRRHYVAVASAAAAAAAGDPNLSLGGANGAAGGNGLGGGLVSGSAAAMGWPGSLPTALTPTHATTTTAAAAAPGGPKGGPASTGSPSRFFAGPGMESLPQMLEVPSSVLHTAGAMNFSTAATSTGGGSSLNPPVVLAAAAAPQQQHDGKHSGSDSSAAGASGQAPPVSKAGGSGWAATGDRFGPNTSHHQQQQQQQQQQHVQNNNNNSTSVASRGQRHGNRSHAHSSSAGEKSFRGGGHNNNNNNNRSTSASFGGGGGSTAGNRCSHDNTPQEQKYLQTDPFSMYEHNKKIAAGKEAAA